MTHPLARTRWRRLLRAGRSFSVSELLVAVAILGILSAVVIDLGLREWRREQVNSVVVELAGWLQSVRRGALKGNSCTVNLTQGRLDRGARLAQVSSCGGVAALHLHGLAANQPVVVALLRAPEHGFTFTPAGTLSPPPQRDAPIVIQVALEGHPDSGRCLQLEGLLGAIDLGVSSGESCVVGGGF